MLGSHLGLLGRSYRLLIFVLFWSWLLLTLTSSAKYVSEDIWNPAIAAVWIHRLLLFTDVHDSNFGALIDPELLLTLLQSLIHLTSTWTLLIVLGLLRHWFWRSVCWINKWMENG